MAPEILQYECYDHKNKYQKLNYDLKHLESNAIDLENTYLKLNNKNLFNDIESCIYYIKEEYQLDITMLLIWYVSEPYEFENISVYVSSKNKDLNTNRGISVYPKPLNLLYSKLIKIKTIDETSYFQIKIYDILQLYINYKIKIIDFIKENPDFSLITESSKKIFDYFKNIQNKFNELLQELLAYQLNRIYKCTVKTYDLIKISEWFCWEEKFNQDLDNNSLMDLC